MNEPLIVSAFLVDVAVMSALAIWDTKLMRPAIVVNMILISLWSRYEIHFFGLVSNMGNVFYAAALYGMTLVTTKYGLREALKTVFAVFCCMVLFYCMGKTADFLIDKETKFLTSLFGIDYNIVGASFLAFYVSNVVNAGMLQHFNKILSNITAQFVDSIIFFPIAFINTIDFQTLVSWMIGGLAIKAFLNTVDTPIFNFTKKYLE